MPKKQKNKKDESNVEKIICPSCVTKEGKPEVQMGQRQVETDRDGNVTATIFACPKCHTWISVPVMETKEKEKERLKKRLAELEE